MRDNMKNAINYYYNLFPDHISNIDNYFYFTIDDELYHLKPYTRSPNEGQAIIKLNKEMTNRNLLVHEIVINKNKDIITIINNIPYLLYKVIINPNKKISLSEISFLSNQNIPYDKELERTNWDVLWSNKIDYFEYQINQIGKKHPYIVDSFSYYTGLAENAISYVKNTLIEAKPELSDQGTISHRKIQSNLSVYDLYDPNNIIIDHKARDLAEYIKLSFFTQNHNIFKELDVYFNYNYFSYYGIRLLFARIIYPSYYFDLYEDILLDKIKEKKIITITNTTTEFENYLYQVYLYLKKYYNIPEIEWLTARKNEGFILH